MFVYWHRKILTNINEGKLDIAQPIISLVIVIRPCCIYLNMYMDTRMNMIFHSYFRATFWRVRSAGFKNMLKPMGIAGIYRNIIYEVTWIVLISWFAMYYIFQCALFTVCCKYNTLWRTICDYPAFSVNPINCYLFVHARVKYSKSYFNNYWFVTGVHS